MTVESWDTCAESRVTAGAWQIYVVHCIVTLSWTPCLAKPSAILLQLQRINICVRWPMYEWCSPLLILAFFLYSYFNDLCRALLILVFQSMRVLQQAVFMVTFYFICHNCKFVTFYKFLSDNDIAFWYHWVVTEFFLRQFCDAHTCTGGRKPFSRGHRVKLTITLTSFLLCMLWYTLQARKQVTKTYSYTFLINLLKG